VDLDGTRIHYVDEGVGDTLLRLDPNSAKGGPMTDMSGRPILVAGATGRQGGSAVRHLLERQLTVRALMLDPQSDRAKALAGQGIEIARAIWTIWPV
jgi:hypothetical protein